MNTFSGVLRQFSGFVFIWHKSIFVGIGDNSKGIYEGCVNTWKTSNLLPWVLFGFGSLLKGF